MNGLYWWRPPRRAGRSRRRQPRARRRRARQAAEQVRICPARRDAAAPRRRRCNPGQPVRRLAGLVAAGGGLPGIQGEHWRCGADQGDGALGGRPERRGVAGARGTGYGGRVGAEVGQLGGDAVRRRLPRIGIVVGKRDRAGGSDGRGDAYLQRVVACQPAVEGQPVGLHGETGDGGELAGEPVNVGGVAGLPV